MKTWRIVQHIYEGDDMEPVLTHIFYGKTLEEADGIYQAHMQTDSFMRGCATRQKFRDFSCYARSHVERMNSRGKWITS